MAVNSFFESIIDVFIFIFFSFCTNFNEIGQGQQGIHSSKRKGSKSTSKKYISIKSSCGRGEDNIN